MNAFLVYLLKGSVLLSVFLAFFLLVMRRSEHFRLNRVALLAGSALCLLLPLVRFRVNRPTLYSEWLEPVAVSAGEGAGRAAVTTAGGLTLSWPAFLLFVYLVGVLVASGFFEGKQLLLVRFILFTQMGILIGKLPRELFCISHQALGHKRIL